MEEDGYDVSRFQDRSRAEALLCCFCLNVPKDPRICRKNDHVFCYTHIAQYLQTSQKCPTCNQKLTLETLRSPRGFLKSSYDDLIINCYFHDRGCPEQVRLESLQNHVDQCEYAPALCKYEGCGKEINKRDKEVHEKDFCQFRFARCHECRDIKATVDQMYASQDQMQQRVDVTLKQLSEMQVDQNNMGSTLDALKDDQDEIRARVEQVAASQDEIIAILKQMRTNPNEMNALLEQARALKDEMTAVVEQVRASRNELNAKEEQIRASQRETNEIVEQMRASQIELNALLKQTRAIKDEMTAVGEQVRVSRNEINGEEEQIRASQNQANGRHEQMRASPIKLNALSEQTQASKNEMDAGHGQTKATEELKQVKDSMTGVKRKQNEIGPTLKKLKESLDEDDEISHAPS